MSSTYPSNARMDTIDKSGISPSGSKLHILKQNPKELQKQYKARQHKNSEAALVTLPKSNERRVDNHSAPPSVEYH